MSSDERYLPPQSEDLGSRTGQAAPALWNPNAAACWSLLFSPIFGAALHMFNARAMGDAELEKLNKGFMWGTLAVLVIAILLAIFSGIKANFVGIAALGAWYGAVGRKQVALVKERSTSLMGQAHIVRYPRHRRIVYLYLYLAFYCLLTRPKSSRIPLSGSLRCRKSSRCLHFFYGGQLLFLLE